MTFDERERETVRRLRDELRMRCARNEVSDRTRQLDRTRAPEHNEVSDRTMQLDRTLYPERNEVSDRTLGPTTASSDRTLAPDSSGDATPAVLSLDEWAVVRYEVTA
jgi:hypothetical protein